LSTVPARRSSQPAPHAKAQPKPLVRVGSDFEAEFPGASALATECFANLCRTGSLLIELHNRQTRDDYQLSQSAREVLAVVEGAGEPLEPTVIAQRLLITTASMTTLLDTLERRGLVRRLAHPEDRRKRLIDITPTARQIVDEFLPSFHARERAVVTSALTVAEQRALLRLLAKVQQAALDASASPTVRNAGRRRRSASPATVAPVIS
jgi:MarR family transcriptional regulator, 2-MHQ and catechol-resistance regulon repressor